MAYRLRSDHGRFAHQDVCGRGIHDLTKPNAVYLAPSGRRSCRQCNADRSAEWHWKHDKRRPSRRVYPHETGTCKSGMHAWVPENIAYDKQGQPRCKLCRRMKNAEYRKRKTITTIYCLGSPCNQHTQRSTGNTYLCPKHRANPPSWIATLGYSIVGTEVLAA